VVVIITVQLLQVLLLGADMITQHQDLLGLLGVVIITVLHLILVQLAVEEII
jgi:hypothetical protein